MRTIILSVFLLLLASAASGGVPSFEYVPAADMRVDMGTGLLWLVPGTSGAYIWLTPIKQAVVVMDEAGDIADVSVDGALQVVEHGGLPQYGAEVTGADTYATAMVLARDCRHICATTNIKSAIVSLDGGAHDAFAVGAVAVAGGTSIILNGIYLPKGTIIQTKNETSGQNYGSVYLIAW